MVEKERKDVESGKNSGVDFSVSIPSPKLEEKTKLMVRVKEEEKEGEIEKGKEGRESLSSSLDDFEFLKEANQKKSNKYVPLGSPFAFSRGSGKTVVLFRSANGEIHRMFKNSTIWEHSNLSSVLNCPPSIDEPIGFYNRKAKQEIVCFTNSNNQILLLQKTRNQEFWSVQEISQKLAPAKSCACIFLLGSLHLVYVSTNDHVIDLYLTKNNEWKLFANLSEKFGSSSPLLAQTLPFLVHRESIVSKNEFVSIVFSDMNASISRIDFVMAKDSFQWQYGDSLLLPADARVTAYLFPTEKLRVLLRKGGDVIVYSNDDVNNITKALRTKFGSVNVPEVDFYPVGAAKNFVTQQIFYFGVDGALNCLSSGTADSFTHLKVSSTLNWEPEMNSNCPPTIHVTSSKLFIYFFGKNGHLYEIEEYMSGFSVSNCTESANVNVK